MCKQRTNRQRVRNTDSCNSEGLSNRGVYLLCTAWQLYSCMSCNFNVCMYVNGAQVIPVQCYSTIGGPYLHTKYNQERIKTSIYLLLFTF